MITTTHQDEAAPVATGRAGTRGVLVSMCLSLVLVVASVSALNLALPDLAIDLSASNGALTWIADAYTVALAAFVLPLGAIGDRLGRRNVLVVGTVVFGGASLAASFTDSTSTLITWRAVMGLGAAMIMPGTLSTITAAFPAEQRAKGVATWSGFAAAGAIIGMLAAGALLEQFSWRSIFVVSAATALAAGLAAALLAPNTKDAHPHRPDVAGAVTTAVAIGSLVYAIIEGNERGWTEPVVIGAFVVTVVPSPPTHSSACAPNTPCSTPPFSASGASGRGPSPSWCSSWPSSASSSWACSICNSSWATAR
ncbi:MFS transporter [Streptomyces sp. 351MFTsu5.1]|uniref:MFS transporter n=1 Tax=Streptomyces sp. 351MFTsu5.1 TaxID=1172180 RepID=UPI00039A8784|nr:MFS transporter [Streptomyces sp. 351MFTsu5.1]